MPYARAVAFVDHAHATVHAFDPENVQTRSLEASGQRSKQRHSDVRHEHEFFGHVCDALAAFESVLVTGPKTGLADFRHYVEKHRPALAPKIADYETVDHPTEGQLVARGREFFKRLDGGLARPAP